MIQAKIIKDSVHAHGPRLTTFVLKYPRYIHAQVMTHRVFSRNAASSRAIPTARLIELVEKEPAIPVYWGKNKAGMQSNEELSAEQIQVCIDTWLKARDNAVVSAKAMNQQGLHKEICNRVLEPFQHIEVVLTGTDWTNFYKLRAHKDAQHEIQELALKMQAAHKESIPRILRQGEWHLPFITDREENSLTTEILLKTSAARCARVSYLKHDKTSATFEEDLALYDRLMSGDHIHASPAEHQAQVPSASDFSTSNLRGWYQYRKVIESTIYGQEQADPRSTEEDVAF